jgi:glycosyltransferase involved in cell wall biosynthesis
MRILHVIDYLADSDGHAAACLRIAAEQARRGDVCAVATCRLTAAAGAGMQAGVALRALPGREWRPAGYPLVVPRPGAVPGLLREFQPDAVHLHGLWDPLVLAGAREAGRAGIPAVLSPHGVLAPWAARRRTLAKRAVWHLLARPCFRRIGAWHATSGQEAEQIRCWGWRGAVGTVPLGVDMPGDLPDASGPAAARTAGAPRTALFLSRLHAKKGLPMLLAAWAGVRPTGWQLVIAGPGSPGAIAALRSDIEALRLSSDVRLAGEVRGEERERQYREADLLVLPSYTENFGLVVAEALARGLPVITTRGTPWQELAAHRCGWWVEAAVAPLAQALQEASALSDDERRAMGLRGRDLVRTRYSWASCEAGIRELYARAARS